jgi:hypothetical protein
MKNTRSEVAEISQWERFLRDGRQYRNVMKGAVRRPAVFTPEIVYNVAGMALEKMIMAYLMKRGALPEGHTLIELMQALQGRLDVPASLQHDVLYMEGFQEICGIDDYHRSAPDLHALQRIVSAVDAIADLIESELS